MSMMGLDSLYTIEGSFPLIVAWKTTSWKLCFKVPYMQHLEHVSLFVTFTFNSWKWFMV